MAGRHAFRGAGALLLAVAAVVGADHFLPPQPAAAPAATAVETRPLTSATLVCPDVDEVGTSTRTSRISFASEQVGGSVTAHWLRPGLAEASYDGSDQTQTLPEQTSNFGGVVLTATGSAAPGFAAGVSSRYDGPATAGTAGIACLEPTTSAYFVGPATSVGHDPRLVLVNPDPSPANVDVSVAEDGKPFSPDTTQGIALPGYGTTTIALVDVAPEQAAVAIHVQTRSGRVTAAVRDRWFTGSRALGIDWLVAGAPPGTDLVLPGVGGPNSLVTLVLASQSTDSGTVVVHARNEAGSFTPAGLESVDVGAGGIVQVTVPRSALGLGGALQVTSDVAVLASAVSVRSDAPPAAGAAGAAAPPVVAATKTDFAWTPAGSALSGPAQALAGTALALTAAADTTVELRAGSLTLNVTVSADTSVSVPMGVFSGVVSVVPKDPGVLYASVIDAPAGLGGSVTTFGLSTPPRTVVVLPARPDIFLGAR